MSERAKQFHTTEWQGVFYVTGGGVSLLAELLNTPGASASVLEAQVPYANLALADLLGRAPEQACSATTARQLAMAAYERAEALGKDHLFGFGCTASLATNRTKKGAHRAHWAIQTASDTFTFSGSYSGDRQQEEQQLLTHLWHSLQHCLTNHEMPVDEALIEIHARANPDLKPLLEKPPYRHCVGEDDGQLLLPGSFNPLHDGHREMLRVAETQTGLSGAFELSVKNADKPSLDYLTIQERVEGVGDENIWLTNTPKFEGKAKLFPHATFALGVDTLARIGELRFYDNHVDLLEKALDTFDECDTRFLVFGRLMHNVFITLEDLPIPQRLLDRCTSVPESSYRNDTSSTEIRRRLNQ